MTSDRCSPRNRTASLLKASPKGEGFHPPREWKVIVRQLLPNLYGTTTSHLQGALPTDRLVAEWYVKSSRVAAALAGREPHDREKNVEATIDIPAKIEELRHSDIEAAKSIQTRVRHKFQQSFAAGLVVAGYRVTEDGGVFELGQSSEAL